MYTYSEASRISVLRDLNDDTIYILCLEDNMILLALLLDVGILWLVEVQEVLRPLFYLT